jgi:hypothetical protein
VTLRNLDRRTCERVSRRFGTLGVCTFSAGGGLPTVPSLAQAPNSIAPRGCRWHEEADSQRIGPERCLAQRDSHQAGRRGVALAPLFSSAAFAFGNGRFSCAQEEFADGDILHIGPPTLGIEYRVRIPPPVSLSAAKFRPAG